MAVANDHSDDTSVLLNNGDGSFAPETRYGVGAFPQGAALGDLDGDGDLDMVIANSGNDRDASVLLNNGDGTFALETRYAVGANPSSVALGDLDGDGDLDLAVTNLSDDDISVLLNTGNGTFAPQIRYGGQDQYPVSALGPVSIALGDLDGDGDLDMVVANYTTAFFDLGFGDISVLLNNGDGAFPFQFQYEAGEYATSVALGDLDVDGDLDMAVANQGNADMSVLLNDGNGSFSTQTRFFAGSFPSSVSLGDLDGDGDLDMAVANQVSGDVSVLLNQCGLPLRFTVQPAGLTVVDAGETVVLEVEAQGAPPLFYRWRRNGVPLNNGGAYSGVRTRTLTIDSAQSIHTDVYDVGVLNDSGPILSDQATVAVRDACPADLNDDGAIDFFDVSIFINLFNAGCP